MIQVEDLCKSFRSLKALDGVSFTARDGEVTALIGPNGAGKTTTLRILYTVMRPDSGVARVDGFDTEGERGEVQRRIGALPDSRSLYPRLTGREHIRYYGRLHGIGHRELERRIDELIATIGMDLFAERRAKGFSKGESMKVALARALVHKPQNLVLDEPTNGLDIASSRTVRKLIRDIRDEGRCILLCSHIMAEVAAVCDRIVVISKGSITAEGTLGELRRQTGKEDLEDIFLALTGTPLDDAGVR